MGWSARSRKQWKKTTWWLMKSRSWAGWTKGRDIHRRPPRGSVCVPSDDPDPAGRRKEIDAARGAYELVPIAEKLDLPVAWNHRTVKSVPRSESYRLALAVPKLFLVVGLGKDLGAAPDERFASLQELDDAYADLGLPPIAANWDDDLEFARQRVHGPNPVWIRAAGSRDDLLARGLDPTVDVPVDADTYVVDYWKLLEGAQPTEGRHFYPCLAIFQEVEGTLTPVGIQLLVDGQSVWRPADGTPAWRLAKVFFGTADMYVHEVVSHWMWLHVVAEKFILASARNLSWRHPIRRLLAPHLSTTLAMNIRAHDILVGNGGTFDTVFSGVGVKARLVEEGDRRWRFVNMKPHAGCAERGTERLAYYPYRDDSARLWDVVEAFARGVVEHYYPDDSAVSGDSELQDFHAQLAEELGDKGLPALDTRAALVEVAASVLFNPLHHSMINGLQYEAYGYAPMCPTIISVPMPLDAADVTEQTLIDALPTVSTALDVIRFTYGFSAQYDRMGSELPDFGLPDGLVEGFRSGLERVDTELARLVEQRGHDYWPARPSTCGNAIDA